MKCQCCQSRDLAKIYETGDLPLFQNKVYANRKAAEEAERGNVVLLRCSSCGFICNGDFDAERMTYDGEYQNEQAHSPYFDRYLDSVVALIKGHGFAGRRIIEIGCGKGAFLRKLWDAGVDARGFDTTYEGTDPRVVRDYFSERYRDQKADLYVLRHTLEHIANPLKFLRDIGAIAEFQGYIYIEVPSFEWIVQHRAFWDIFYEHCNYFTLTCLGNLFSQARSGYLFQGQYMYVLAPLCALKEEPERVQDGIVNDEAALMEELDVLKRFVQQRQDFVVWGAGAKGSTFVNTTDPQREHVSRVVDVNPNKTGKFIAGSGHEIVPPESLPDEPLEILVVNDNYLNEIMAANRDRPYRYYALGTGLIHNV
jgi:SAM-dependent methyltransferase